MRISDWSSDVCSSDLAPPGDDSAVSARNDGAKAKHDSERRIIGIQPLQHCLHRGGANQRHVAIEDQHVAGKTVEASFGLLDRVPRSKLRSEEHTSELQSLMRISYAVFCLKTKTN